MSSPFDPQHQPGGQQSGPPSGGFPAAGQGQGFPAAGQGQGFPQSGQGQGFPQAGQQQGFPQGQGFPQAGPGAPAAGQGFPQSGPGFPQAPVGQPYPMAPGTPIGVGRPRRRFPVWVRLGIAAVVVIVGIVVYFVNQQSDPTTANVGDCLGSLPADSSVVNVSADGAKKVDCTSSDAQAKVLGVLHDKTESDFNNTDGSVLCQSFPGSDTAYYQADSSNSSTGTILCLKSLK